MPRKKRHIVWSLLTVLGLLGTNCGQAVRAPSTPSPAIGEAPLAKPALTATPQAQGQPRYGGILTADTSDEVPHFDHQQVKSPYIVRSIGMVYNGLLEYDPRDPEKIIGDLAERWEVSQDGKEYTFRFNKGITWHDGQPFTAEDARYSINRMWKPPQGTTSGWQDAFGGLAKVEAPDADTLKITLEYPRASLLAFLASAIYIMPKHVIEAKGNMKKDVIGTGPFRFKSYLVGSYTAVERNPNYFKKGRPYVDGFIRYVLKDSSTRFAALRTGQILITGLYSSALTPYQMETARKDLSDKLNVSRSILLTDFRANFNVTKPPFNDIRVRQAISLAMDRQKMVATVGEGYGNVGGALAPGTEWALPQDEIERTPGFRQPKDADIAEARRLLAEAGYASGLKAGFIVRSATLHKAFAEIMKDQVKVIGVDFTIEIVDATTWEDRVRRLAYDAGMKGFSHTIADPDEALGHYQSSNRQNAPTGFADKEVDDLYAKQSQTLDPAERKKVAWEIERRIIKLAPKAAGFWPETYCATSKNVMDYRPGIGGSNVPKYEVVWRAR